MAHCSPIRDPLRDRTLSPPVEPLGRKQLALASVSHAVVLGGSPRPPAINQWVDEKNDESDSEDDTRAAREELLEEVNPKTRFSAVW
jgi:hypothetical protein